MRARFARQPRARLLVNRAPIATIVAISTVRKGKRSHGRPILEDRHFPGPVPSAEREPAAVRSNAIWSSCIHLDRLNYSEAWIGEHHSGGFEIIACPEMFIAAAAERTRHIRLRHRRRLAALPQSLHRCRSHDAARLHDARARHVRCRARLARLRCGQDGAQSGGPAPQAR